METLKKIAKKVPLLRSFYKGIIRKITRYRLERKSAEQVFTEIYKSNTWGGKNSVSGPGSDNYQTRVVRKELSSLISDLRISTILDIPCGDFHWMKNINLKKIDYTGGDIVEELIQKNLGIYGKENIYFQKLNLIKDKLPRMDLIFCRDCLVHFSFADISLALNNICNSQSEYLLTTSFIDRKDNYNIATGQWRALNLELDPFMLPRPLRTINEGCMEKGGIYADKSLVLWKIDDIRESLALN